MELLACRPELARYAGRSQFCFPSFWSVALQDLVQRFDARGGLGWRKDDAISDIMVVAHSMGANVDR